MRKFHGMAKMTPFFSIYDKERQYIIGRNPLHRPRATQMHPMCRARITTKFNIYKDNGGHFTRYRAISIDISCACSPPIADRQSCRHLVRFGLYCRFYSDCNSDIIDRRHCEIHKPIARFIVPSLSLESPSLWRRPVFCDRRLTPPRYRRRRDDIRFRSGAACDKSSHRCCALISFFFFVAFVELDSFARWSFRREAFCAEIKVEWQAKVRYMTLTMF